ncbi:MAG: hypothetical protein KDD04_10100 [Sinomicrobium sp.]|nr:hypothetical protein [Sinomicrobium sp.]
MSKEVTVSFRTTPEVKAALELLALTEGTTITNVLLTAINDKYGNANKGGGHTTATAQAQNFAEIERKFAEAGRNRQRISFE